jgi:SAM-dependent methyltransferase
MCAPGRWSLFRCAGCSCAYLDPRPTEDTTYLAYGDYYAGASAGPAEERTGWRLLRRALRNGYLNSRYGYHLAPATRLGRIIAPLVPGHRQTADEAVRHLDARPGRPRLLDVGCGEGEFLTDMRALGWAVEGIEPTGAGAAVARARGVSVIESPFADVSVAPTSLDAITFRLVFEALHDPVTALHVCARALKPGGVLWIATPNLDSEAHRVFGPCWIFLDPPRYVVLYTEAALVGLLARMGFDVVGLHALRQARWSFRLSTAIARGRPPYKQPPRLPRSTALKARLADLKALAWPQLADVMVVIARKT